MSAQMVDQLAARIQRHSGCPRESCWRLIIQYGIKGRLDYRRWTDPEFNIVREKLVKASVEEVAKKVNRTPIGNFILNAIKQEPELLLSLLFTVGEHCTIYASIYKAIRNMLKRNHLSSRTIQFDLSMHHAFIPAPAAPWAMRLRIV